MKPTLLTLITILLFGCKTDYHNDHYSDAYEGPEAKPMTFEQRMESRLKMTRNEWQKLFPRELFKRLHQEIAELEQSRTDIDGDAEMVANECADVANICKMISDWYLEKTKVP